MLRGMPQSRPAGVGGHEAANRESAATGRSDAALPVAPPGLEPKAEPTIRTAALSAAVLPLLGSNQDSPDPEGPQEPPKLQQLATLYASSCHPMLELPASMLDFALLYSHKC